MMCLPYILRFIDIVYEYIILNAYSRVENLIKHFLISSLNPSFDVIIPSLLYHCFRTGELLCMGRRICLKSDGIERFESRVQVKNWNSYRASRTPGEKILVRPLHVFLHTSLSSLFTFIKFSSPSYTHG